MRILVDIGNSRMKSALDERDRGVGAPGTHASTSGGVGTPAGELEPFETFAWHDTFLHELLARHWLEPLAGRRPDSIHVANVAGSRLLPNLDAWCCQHFGMTTVPMRSGPAFRGLRNGYRDPATFGVDRWAAMIGARTHHPGALCVIDSGTATTVDVIGREGCHIGGAILPGIYTMRRSLGKYTAALFAADGEISPFSDNTASGIAGGTGYASVGAIDRLVEEARVAVGELTVVVTGGESSILAELMRHRVVRDSMLVLRGVREVADEYGTMRPNDRENWCRD